MSETPAILSIQSDVLSGHVGNGAARFTLQRLGFDVFAVPTVLLAYHPGHGGFHGEIMGAAFLRRLLGALRDHGALRRCAGVISGYLGDPEHARIVAEAVAMVKESSPGAIYLCDPVFGDEGGAYARPGVAAAMAKTLLPLADIATPNRFELETLSGIKIDGPGTAHAAAQGLGRLLVIATSIPKAGDLATLAVAEGAAILTRAPRREGVPKGTGDLLAALFLGHRLKGDGTALALQKSTSSLNALIERAVAEGLDELPLIASQEILDRPTALLGLEAP